MSDHNALADRLDGMAARCGLVPLESGDATFLHAAAAALRQQPVTPDRKAIVSLFRDAMRDGVETSELEFKKMQTERERIADELASRLLALLTGAQP